MHRLVRLRNALVAALLLALSIGDGPVEPSAVHAAEPDAVTIELRVWQHVRDYRDVWVSARPEGGRWDTFGTIPFPMTEYDVTADGQTGYGPLGYMAIAGIELRISYEMYADEISVHPCGSHCLRANQTYACLALGTPLPLDDGYSASGRYRYGDLTVEAPHFDPQLVADRDHLLRLRDTLVGAGTLNWDPGLGLANWDGVTVEGSPARVTSLVLADRGLTGELSGLLGDLTGLTELRLDGNALNGRIPSKLTQLPHLAHLYLDGNALHGCVPRPLLDITHTDLGSLPLGACDPPTDLWGPDASSSLTARTHSGWGLTFDVPSNVVFHYDGTVLINGNTSIYLEHESGLWVGLRLERCGDWWVRSGSDVEPFGRELENVGPHIERLVESRWWRDAE